MFVQIITARIVDAEGLWRQVERWEAEIRPGADGFLGSTSGATEDGRLFVMARFDSEESARRNSDRPEQGNWWAETEKMLDDVTFQDSTDVLEMRGGGSNDAGFVQVMRGHVLDATKMADLRGRMGEFEDAMAKARPDVIGDITAMHDDGTYTDVVYFTSEAEARSAETGDIPAEMQSMFEEWMSAASIDEYIDLKQPRLA
ncbi:MAG: hypothetical protein ACR2MO_02835 [Acidimicrobiales bacterium]